MNLEDDFIACGMMLVPIVIVSIVCYTLYRIVLLVC